MSYESKYRSSSLVVRWLQFVVVVVVVVVVVNSSGSSLRLVWFGLLWFPSGRDMALSLNQSPVLKFYNATYPVDYQARSAQFQGDLYPVRGMQLWNDWNTKVWDWAQHELQRIQIQQAKKAHNGSSTTLSTPRTVPDFDYMVVRTEDLIHRKFQVLQRLAEWTSSSRTLPELCCLSQYHVKDYGTSHVHSEHKNNFAAHPEEWSRLGVKKRIRQRQRISNNNHSNSNKRRIEDEYLGENDPRSHDARLQELEDVHELLERRKKEVAAKQHKLAALKKANRSIYTTTTDNTTTTTTTIITTIGERGRRRLDDAGQFQVHDENSKDALADRSWEDPRFQKGEPEPESQQFMARRRRRRRRLDQAKPRLKPEFFLKQLESWQETVHAHGEEFQTETLEKLLDFGVSLLKQYGYNKQALASVVNEKDIQETNAHLQKLLKTRNDPAVIEQKRQAAHRDIHARYGKWKAQLENRTELSRWLHQEGKRGLELFGYEPPLEWKYPLVTTTAAREGLVCNERFQCTQQEHKRMFQRESK